ncbi:hypothetical protein PAPYR_13080 [Paratrimastix pyriformis]|uniref:Uncharacterized protein n=1 Tax=Paratrimastix pyriformis TaxID=342808 RepID=A0ABQ8U5V2_9EUKA|nr:hypothetical protein PAPYR_13080 [Paratrimastix pyriformis]
MGSLPIPCALSHPHLKSCFFQAGPLWPTSLRSFQKSTQLDETKCKCRFCVLAVQVFTLSWFGFVWGYPTKAVPRSPNS